MMVRKTVVVKGRVQGVAFRHHTQATAKRLGVNGWVRNLPDGRVEACFEGELASVTELVDWCRCGPPSSRVDSLDLNEGKFTGEYAGFDIRY